MRSWQDSNLRRNRASGAAKRALVNWQAEVMALNDAAKSLIEAGKLAHAATVNADGSPQLSVIWVGVDGDELVSGHMGAWQKVRNLRTNPKVVLSFEGDTREANGMQHSLLIHATARVTEGGAAQLLYDLGKIYVGADAEFRPSEDPDAGYVVHYAVDKVGGFGPWNQRYA
jgi:PPOX class probable F420-dependent enzyme